LRGDGDVVVTGLLPANGSTLAVDTTRTVYSAEFNLCTGCHMVDLTATFEPTAGYGQRGMYLYELSDKYTSANLVDAVSGTFDLTKAVFYHDGASGNGRTLVDTHFGGTIMQHLVAFDGSADDIPIKGYNINPGNEDACTICHDPHTAGKLLSIEASSTTVEYSDIIDNKAISYAEGLGDFHTNYLDDPFSRVSTSSSCMPCHSGNAYLQKVLGDDISDNNWKVVGCRTCHNLDQPNSTPASNDSAAFAQVRAFPAGYEFAFNSGEIVDVAALGNNQICFDCHKGRTPGVDVTALTDSATGTRNYDISYLHYAPSMAILYGDDSKMVATYPGKTYSGRFAHPFDAEGILGETEFGCVDCHDVHNTNANHVVGNKMENLAYACAGCHLVDTSLDPAALQARTQDFSERLLDTILAEMLTFADDTALDAALQTKIDELAAEVDPVVQKAILMAYIQERTVYFPNIAVAHAATSWKVFTYEDGAPQGQTHGHGGSWAHNSAFARQVMYDAIESLGGDLTGLTRP
jgi:predicted CXXCH cytochrome family protein